MRAVASSTAKQYRLHHRLFLHASQRHRDRCLLQSCEIHDVCDPHAQTCAHAIAKCNEATGRHGDTPHTSDDGNDVGKLKSQTVKLGAGNKVVEKSLAKLNGELIAVRSERAEVHTAIEVGLLQ